MWLAKAGLLTPIHASLTPPAVLEGLFSIGLVTFSAVTKGISNNPVNLLQHDGPRPRPPPRPRPTTTTTTTTAAPTTTTTTAASDNNDYDDQHLRPLQRLFWAPTTTTTNNWCSNDDHHNGRPEPPRPRHTKTPRISERVLNVNDEKPPRVRADDDPPRRPRRREPVGGPARHGFRLRRIRTGRTPAPSSPSSARPRSRAARWSSRFPSGRGGSETPPAFIIGTSQKRPRRFGGGVFVVQRLAPPPANLARSASGSIRCLAEHSARTACGRVDTEKRSLIPSRHWSDNMMIRSPYRAMPGDRWGSAR